MALNKFPNEYEIDNLVVDENIHQNARRGWLIIGATVSLMFSAFFIL